MLTTWVYKNETYSFIVQNPTLSSPFPMTYAFFFSATKPPAPSNPACALTHISKYGPVTTYVTLTLFKFSLIYFLTANFT